MVTENRLANYLMDVCELENRSMWAEFREKYSSQYRGETAEDFRDFLIEEFPDFEDLFGRLMQILNTEF